MPFEQAELKVEKQQEFGELRGAIERSTAPGAVGEFLKQMKKSGLRVRQFEAVLERGVLEKCDGGLRSAGVKAAQLYQSLALADRSLIREFYLERIEQVDDAVRVKFHGLYSDGI